MVTGLEKFIEESNKIEGILRKPLPVEIKAHQIFLLERQVTVETIEEFVSMIAPGIRLREEKGMNVTIGPHRPPPGSKDIKIELAALLINLSNLTPFDAHRHYEYLHPFMDINGRSGRALWLHMMTNLFDPFAVPPLGFLHTYYYQSLDNYSEGD